jgi:hypothetical protein
MPKLYTPTSSMSDAEEDDKALYVHLADYDVLKLAAEDAFDAYDAWWRLNFAFRSGPEREALTLLHDKMATLHTFFNRPKTGPKES